MVSANNEEKCFDMVQVEVTSRCNLSCRTCLKHTCKNKWVPRDIDSKLFARLLSQLTCVPAIHLQGWGEPLLVKQLEEYISMAKQAGLVVSFTTNGLMMSPQRAKSLIMSGVDGVTFSLAGATAEVHDYLRGEGSFNSSWQSMANLQEEKRKTESITPKIAVSYLLTPETVAQLPKAARMARRAGVDLFSTVHLTQATSQEQKKMQMLIKDARRLRQLKKIIRQTHWPLLFSRMKVELKPFSPSLVPVCDKNPINNFFVGVDGSVSPCVFLQPPISDKIPWVTTHGVQFMPRLNFGNLADESLTGIWNRDSYRNFRKIFQTRLAIYTKAMARVGFGMDGGEQLEYALKVIRRGFRKVPPPPACLHCLKMQGL